MKNTNALQVIRELDRQSTFSFSYTQTQLEKIPLESFSYTNILLGKALDMLARRAGLAFNVAGSVIAIRVTEPAPETPAPNPQAKPGKVTGFIRNEKNEVMPGVSVKVEGSEKGVSTAVTGDYVLTLQPGNYTLLVSFIGHQTKRITDVIIKESEVTDLSIVMKQKDASQLEAVVVTSGARRESVRALLMTQKNNAAITDGISAEQIKVTPDNNTAQVLKRVSGITIQNNKFVTIRGVSDRYNNVLINGASLPSTEPNRRNFSFDIVPSALVDNIVINKTATPDLPSEFTGGMVQINTKDVPARDFLEIGIGSGFNTVSAGKEFLSFKRDEQAAWGKVDDNRRWFGDGRLFDPVVYQQKANVDHDTAYQKRIGKAIPNRWQTYKYPYMPVQNYQLAGGISRPLGSKGQTLGMVAAVTYRGEQLFEEGDARVVTQSDVFNQRYQYTTALGALLNTAYKTKRHKIAWKNLFNRRYSDQFNVQAGAYDRYGRYAKRMNDATLTNNMLQTRVEGEHVIGKIRLKLDWYGDYTRLKREQPDTRFLTGRSEQAAGRIDSLYDVNVEQKGYDFTEFTTIRTGLHSSVLEEHRKNAGGNISLPFALFKDKQLFKVGYAWSQRKVDFDASNIIVQEGFNRNNYSQSKGGAPFYEIVTPEAFERGDLKYLVAYPKQGTTGDRYTGTQTLKAAYAMLDLRFIEKLRLTGGFRYEDNRMDLSTVFYNLQGYSTFDDTTYREKDWLPSVNATYNITEKFNIRGAWSRTLARPDFVERSPYTYFDFMELTNVIGRKGVQYSRIDNYDVRFEYYPSASEILSGSLFFKRFDKPVERFYYLGDVLNIVEYKNLVSATAKGFEIDARKSFGFIAPEKGWLQNLYISGNFTYLEGKIKVDVTTRNPVTNKDTTYIAAYNRPIQGLSPYIINGGLLYQGKVWGFNIAYNRFGRRIVNGGADPSLVQYENPRDVVDLQLTLRLMKQKMELRFNVSDILNQYFIVYSNNAYRDDYYRPRPSPSGDLDPKGEGLNENVDFVNYKVKRGSNISLNLTYKF